MRPAVFLDRDGVINVDGKFVHCIEDFQFVQGIFAALRSFTAWGYQVVIVTNQSGIGRGFYTETDFQKLSAWMLAQITNHGATVTDIYHCPHHPESGCACRKPEPGMLQRAAHDHRIDMGNSWMIGDRKSDVEAAIRAGVGNIILLDKGVDQGHDRPRRRGAKFFCRSLEEAVGIITSTEKQK